jgi:hypothetical protein
MLYWNGTFFLAATAIISLSDNPTVFAALPMVILPSRYWAKAVSIGLSSGNEAFSKNIVL